MDKVFVLSSLLFIVLVLHYSFVSSVRTSFFFLPCVQCVCILAPF